MINLLKKIKEIINIFKYTINKGEYMLTEDKLQAIFIHADEDNIEQFCNIFNKYAIEFKITKEVHVNFLLAQLRQEIGTSLTPRRENLNYSCSALPKIFKFYRKNPKAAKKDGRCNNHRASQQKIANNVYAHRLGNIESNDGWDFRGGGYIQLTGRDNYMRIANDISKTIDQKCSPDDLKDKIQYVDYALLTAMSFWKINKLYKCKTIDDVTAKVNKYTDSYSKRKSFYKKIASL